ncbi:mitotic spindle assembly checkpoint protein MAD1-like protein [Leptotrombidium deliense]|uniref:Mitotic spindle assembly checkpoint protein MAD1-like protein n=1 Tax=Leptotrombidium deliense TaxID=299467 RepID=A0A443SIT3_9ACAR|nr:mitotic spindle assembly checkpoint protein MAD1-like protein [Leptotrombidium deliense]
MNEKDINFWKLVDNESQVIRLKAEIEHLKSLSQTSKDNYIQEHIALRKEIEKLQQDVRNEQEKVLSAKREIKAREEKFDACSEQLAFARSEFFAEKEIFEKRILDLQKQNQALKAGETEFIAKVDSLRREHRNDLIDRDNLVRSLQFDVEMLAKEKQVLMRQLEAAYSSLKDVNHVESQLNCSLEEKNLLEEQLKKSNESQKLSDIFQDELKELKLFRAQNEELRKENEILQKSALFVDELRAKTEVMEIEISNLNKALESVPELKRNLETLKDEIKNWQSVTGLQNPSDVAEQIASLNEVEQRLCNEVKFLKGRCEELSKTNEEKTLIEGSTVDMVNVFNYVKPVESTKPAEVAIQVEMVETVDQKLESENNNEMISDGEPSRKRTKRVADPTSCETSELESLRNQLREQTDLNKNVLEENKELKKRLEQFENLKNSEQNTKSSVETTKSTDNEVEKIKQQLITNEKKYHHIIEAVKRTSKEFREVVNILTGYRIDVLKQKMYRLSHVYSTNPSDVLLFELENVGSMKLVSNDYSEQLSSLIDNYVKKRESFPALLASVTMDLFERQPQIASESSSKSVNQ